MALKRTRKHFEADLQKKESPYVCYGTPLPPLDEQTRDDGSYVPVWQQEVTDDRGRKRLHGAFTGGYSAGYFNTVGSKEGWTPSTFVSSRQNRKKDGDKRAQQRPEDFMDEEDMREAEDSRRLATSESFMGFGTTEEDARRKGGLIDIFRPVGETIGVKLLKKMGWKEGQGIGPRVRRKANIDDEDDDSAEVHLFAPDDPPMISLLNKKDFKGVGYAADTGPETGLPAAPKVSYDGLSDNDDLSTSRSASGPKLLKPSKKSSFGVGILNDTGSDDEDPYEISPKISFNKFIGSDKKLKKKKGASIGTANPLLKEKPLFMSKKLLAGKNLSGFRKCHDGRLPIDGFVLSSELDSFASISLEEDSFKLLEIPRDWKSSKVPSTDSGTASYMSTGDAAKASSHTAQSRAGALGEAQLPSKSIFDFLTPAARNRLAQASGKSDLPPAGNEAAPPGFEAPEDQKTRSLLDLVPKLDSEVALQALARGTSGWMPYSEDEFKRARYRSYLEIRAGLRKDINELPSRASGMSVEDWALEMQEFARAAQLFKPVTGLMSSRFTSSTAQGITPSGGADASISTDQLLSKPPAKPEDPGEAAARMGMFGPLTRSVQNWYTTRLLCKRFNVKAPDHAGVDSGNSSMGQSGGFGGAAAGASRFQISGYQYGENLESAVTGVRSRDEKVEGTDLKMREAAPLSTGQTSPQALQAAVVDPERNEALEDERPGEAVFRAIFGSDDEDENENE